MNGDGLVNIADVTEIIDLMINNNGEYFANADVDGNGVINIADVTSLIDMLLNAGN